jgi:hypothetical protein
MDCEPAGELFTYVTHHRSWYAICVCVLSCMHNKMWCSKNDGEIFAPNRLVARSRVVTQMAGIQSESWRATSSMRSSNDCQTVGELRGRARLMWGLITIHSLVIIDKTLQSAFVDK